MEFPYTLSLASITNPPIYRQNSFSKFRDQFRVFLRTEFLPNLFVRFKTEFLKRVMTRRKSNLYWGELLRLKSFLTPNRGPAFPKEAASSPRSLVAAFYLISQDSKMSSRFLNFFEDIGDMETWRWFRWGLKTVHRIVSGSIYNTSPRFSLLGKLGFKEEPAGKLRVFAMLDILTQWAFKS